MPAPFSGTKSPHLTAPAVLGLPRRRGRSYFGCQTPSLRSARERRPRSAPNPSVRNSQRPSGSALRNMGRGQAEPRERRASPGREGKPRRRVARERIPVRPSAPSAACHGEGAGAVPGGWIRGFHRLREGPAAPGPRRCRDAPSLVLHQSAMLQPEGARGTPSPAASAVPGCPLQCPQPPPDPSSRLSLRPSAGHPAGSGPPRALPAPSVQQTGLGDAPRTSSSRWGPPGSSQAPNPPRAGQGRAGGGADGSMLMAGPCRHGGEEQATGRAAATARCSRLREQPEAAPGTGWGGDPDPATAVPRRLPACPPNTPLPCLHPRGREPAGGPVPPVTLGPGFSRSHRWSLDEVVHMVGATIPSPLRAPNRRSHGGCHGCCQGSGGGVWVHPLVWSSWRVSSIPSMAP